MALGSGHARWPTGALHGAYSIDATVLAELNHFVFMTIRNDLDRRLKLDRFGNDIGDEAFCLRHQFRVGQSDRPQNEF
jgi:hypothetical protein